MGVRMGFWPGGGLRFGLLTVQGPEQKHKRVLRDRV